MDALGVWLYFSELLESRVDLIILAPENFSKIPTDLPNSSVNTDSQVLQSSSTSRH